MRFLRPARTGLAPALGLVGLSVTTTAAISADLPAKSSVPAEYVRICSLHGNGYFYIPGTETCLRIGGRLRAEVRYLEPGSRIDDVTGFRARGRLDIDTRTHTSYGLLRAFIRYELTNNSGNFGASTTNLERAFVEFGGLTAGRVQSFFDFYANDYNFGSIFVSDFSSNALAYTVKLGSELNATLALEDGIARRQYTAVNGVGFPGQSFLSAGQAMPDVVSQLLWTGTWGKAQLSAALHQIRSDNIVTALPTL